MSIRLSTQKKKFKSIRNDSYEGRFSIDITCAVRQKVMASCRSVNIKAADVQSFWLNLARHLELPCAELTRVK